MAALAPEQAAALTAAKLRGLVSHHLGEDLSEVGTTSRSGGAGLAHHGAGWFLAADDGPRTLGRALVWASAQGVSDLNVISEVAPGTLARRAREFAPGPTVWAVSGRSLTRAEPAPPPAEPVPAPSTEEFALLLRSAGVDVVVEHGVVTGEVDGLEVARVLVDPDGAASLEVGVGRHDREAFTLLHGTEVAHADALVDVATTVRHHRRPGAEAHPLNRLAASRRLRARLLAEPARVGVSTLEPVPPALPRDDLRVDVPAAAIGHDERGGTVVVVASVGIDLDLVPEAADVRQARASEASLRLVVPERDDHPRTREQAARLREPAEVVTVPDDWHRPTP